jgi:diguanylate cyclase (GGDEF)-like protein/PAS domain S-box-containing protein
MTEHEAGLVGEGVRGAGSNEDLLELALSQLPKAGAAVIGLDSRIVAAFGEVFDLRGITTGNIVGKTLAEVFPDEATERLDPALEAAFAGQRSSLEIRADDGVSWYRVETRPVTKDGAVVAAFLFAIDVSDRKEAEVRVTQEKQFFEDVLDSIGHLITVKADDLRVLYLNRCFEQYTGITRDEAEGRMLAEFYDPKYSERFMRDDMEVLEKNEATRTERRVPAADGSVGTYLTDRAPLRREDGSVYGVVTVGVDLSERIAAERELAEARKLFQTVFTSAPNGVALIALDGSFLRVNPAMCELTGYSADELTTMRVADIAHPDDLQDQIDLARRALSGAFENYSMEKRFSHKNGETIWLLVAVSLVTSATGEPPYVIAHVTDISDRKQIEVDLRSEAGRDPLTGLANRRQFETALEGLAEKCRTNDTRASLLLLDIDGFKQVNDSYGHEVGDRLLKFIAGELTARVRSTDLAGRIGGDEFVLLLDSVGPARATEISNELMDHFDHVKFEPESLNLRCSTSVGSAGMTADTASAQAVLREADLAMYEAKRSRRPG